MPDSCCSGSPRKRKQPYDCNQTTAAIASVKHEPCCSAPAQNATNDTQTVGQACASSCDASELRHKWIAGTVDTPTGPVPRVHTTLAFGDMLGSWKARWNIGRMDYSVDPGLYCVGAPDDKSPVLVTANYKMTFDRLRKELTNVNAWILVLDTKGINVWCAAGKGTFGTEELLRRIEESRLKQVVSHRILILPQLGAVGVAAHEVAKQSGFKVTYGPVRAEDLKAYLAAGMKASEEMRRVRFTLWDRLVLAPLEVVMALKPMMIVFGVLFILNAIGIGHYGFMDLVAYLGTILAGCVLTPALLPWIPGRAFSFKGALVGMLWAVGVILLAGWVPPMPLESWMKAIAYVLVLPSLSAYGAMNFTGSSTFTSMSGVDREMRIALPLMLIATALGVILLIVQDFIVLFH